MAKIIYTHEEKSRLAQLLPNFRQRSEFGVWLFESSWRAIAAGTAAEDEFDDYFEGEILASIKALGKGKPSPMPSRLRLQLTDEEKAQVRRRQASGMNKRNATLAVEAEILLQMAEGSASAVRETRHRYTKPRAKRIKKRLAEFRLSVAPKVAEQLEEIAFDPPRLHNLCVHAREGDGSTTYLYDIEGCVWHLLHEQREVEDDLDQSDSRCGITFLGDATKEHQMMRVYLVFQLSCTEKNDISICRKCLPDLKTVPRFDFDLDEDLANA